MKRYTLTDHQAYVEAEEKRKAAGELCHDLPFSLPPPAACNTLDSA
jgi:hypothetical protein